MSFLTDENLSYIKTIVNDMTANFGKSCKIYYHPIMVDCANCTDTIGNKTTNTWNHGGPMPLPCDFCNGVGKIPQSVTENIKMVIDWQPKEYKNNLGGVALDFKVIKSRIMLYDLPKILQANEIEVDLPSSNYVKGFYRVLSNSSDTGAILSQSYSIVFLERIR